jgi:hypothetical protein
MLTLSKPPPRASLRTPPVRSDWPTRSARLLAEVDRLLQAGRARGAVDEIGLSYLSCPRTANALAVCHLRLGNTVRALRLLRHIAADDTGRLRPDVPTVFKTNLATTLLVAGDVTGCLAALDQIGDENHPAVRRLRAAVARWTASLSAWERFVRRFGIRPARVPEIDEPVGELSAVGPP